MVGPSSLLTGVQENRPITREKGVSACTRPHTSSRALGMTRPAMMPSLISAKSLKVKLRKDADRQASSFSNQLQMSVWILSAEKPPATPAPGDGKCLPGWWTYGRHCYFAYNGKVGFSWPEARHFCQEVNGGELASIHSRAEVEFIRNINYTKYHYVWIGLTRDRSCTQQSCLSVFQCCA